MSRNRNDLLQYETDKYDLLHTEKGFGKDPDRTKPKDYMTEEMDNPEFSKFYLDMLTDLDSILEIGTGPGTTMKWMKDDYNLDVHGIDISSEMINYVKELFPEFSKTAVVGSAHQLPYSDNYFDIVQHLDGMEHIPVEWEEEALKESIRVTKKYVVHSDACQDASADRWAEQLGFDAAHVNVKSPEEWNKFYSKYQDEFGYKIVKEWAHKVYEHSNGHGDYVYNVILEIISE